MKKKNLHLLQTLFEKKNVSDVFKLKYKSVQTENLY